MCVSPTNHRGMVVHARRLSLFVHDICSTFFYVSQSSAGLCVFMCYYSKTAILQTSYYSFRPGLIGAAATRPMNWDDGWTNNFYITRQLRRRLRRYSPRRESQLKDSSKDDQLAINLFHDLTMDWKGPVIDGVGNLCQLSPSFIHVGHWPGDVTWDANLRIAIYFLFWLRFFFQCKPTLRVHWHCGKSNSVGSSQALKRALFSPRPSTLINPTHLLPL